MGFHFSYSATTLSKLRSAPSSSFTWPANIMDLSMRLANAITRCRIFGFLPSSGWLMPCQTAASRVRSSSGMDFSLPPTDCWNSLSTLSAGTIAIFTRKSDRMPFRTASAKLSL